MIILTATSPSQMGNIAFILRGVAPHILISQKRWVPHLGAKNPWLGWDIRRRVLGQWKWVCPRITEPPVCAWQDIKLGTVVRRQDSTYTPIWRQWEGCLFASHILSHRYNLTNLKSSEIRVQFSCTHLDVFIYNILDQAEKKYSWSINNQLCSRNNLSETTERRRQVDEPRRSKKKTNTFRYHNYDRPCTFTHWNEILLS